MTRRAVAAFVAMVAIAPALTGCQQPSTTIAATGRVLADTVAVQAPSLAVPKISLDAGFPMTPGTAATTSTVPALLSLGTAQRVSAVEVRLGDRVSAGDVLVRFDDAALAAQLRVAEADAAVARSQIGVLDAALDSLADKQRDLREKRQEIVDGIAKATKARKEFDRQARGRPQGGREPARQTRHGREEPAAAAVAGRSRGETRPGEGRPRRAPAGGAAPGSRRTPPGAAEAHRRPRRHPQADRRPGHAHRGDRPAE
ncbi:MAG: biotin/lipoyl-binding protein [Micropruina sp.]|uniref:biotin/lipoyl-binding protein n=1 Tax=Micropruina sp. TaxID=2737536 RepID=UPI0039E3F715